VTGPDGAYTIKVHGEPIDGLVSSMSVEDTAARNPAEEP